MKNIYSDDISNLNDLNVLLFPVEKISILEAFDIDSTEEKNMAIIGYPEGKRKLLHVCSNRYELRQCCDIFLPIEAKFRTKGINYIPIYRHNEYTKFYVRYILNDEKYKIKSGADIIMPQITIMHSYNGTLQYTIMFGWHRENCKNELSIPIAGKDEFIIKNKHTESIQSSIDELFEYLQRFRQFAPEQIESFNLMYDHAVSNPKQRAIEVIEATKLFKTHLIEKKIKVDITEEVKMVEILMLKESQALQTPINDWLVYNAINEVLYNDNFNKKSPEIRMELDKKVLDYMLLKKKKNK